MTRGHLDGVRLLLDRTAHVIFHHDDDRLGPADHDEWQAFVRDSEGNTVGLIAFQRP